MKLNFYGLCRALPKGRIAISSCCTSSMAGCLPRTPTRARISPCTSSPRSEHSAPGSKFAPVLSLALISTVESLLLSLSRRHCVHKECSVVVFTGAQLGRSGSCCFLLQCPGGMSVLYTASVRSVPRTCNVLPVATRSASSCACGIDPANAAGVGIFYCSIVQCAATYNY